MKRFGAALLLTAIACSGVGESTTTNETGESEPGRFVAELTAASGEVEQAENFSTDPVGGEGHVICVGVEELHVYLFGSDEEGAAAAARIDPNDPSNLGNAIVDWVGNPRFWQRGPMLVLYLGEDEATENLISELLGPPFAVGAGRGGGLPALPGPCIDS